MLIINTLKSVFLNLPSDWNLWVPADHISRQAWQVGVEQAIEMLRENLNKPEFQLSPSEISIFYHKPLGEFAAFIADRTNSG